MLDAASGRIVATDEWGGVGPQFPARVSVDDDALFVSGIGTDPDGVEAGEIGAGQDPYLERRDPRTLEVVERRTFGEGANREPWGGLDHEPAGAAADITGTGTIYAAGWTFGSFRDQQEPAVPLVADRNSWLAGFDPDLALRFDVTFGSPDGSDWAWDLAVGDDGFVYVVGQTYGSMDGPGSQLGLGDGYVVKIDPAAPAGRSVVWQRHIGTDAGDEARSIEVVGDRLVISGHTWGAFDGASNAGGSDVWLASVDPADGTPIEIVQLGSAGDERAFVAAHRDETYLAGTTTDSFAGRHAGGPDGYVIRMP